MNRHAKAPRADSLVGKIEAYFRANPNEWLSAEDGAAKFDCTAAQFIRAARNLQLYGWAAVDVTLVVRLKTISEIESTGSALERAYGAVPTDEEA